MSVQLSQHTLASVEGLPLRVDLRCRREDTPRAALIVCHGFKGFKDWGFFPYVSEALAVPGLAVASLNFSKNGIDEDPLEFTRLDLFEANTYSTEIEDLAQVIRWLRRESPLSEHLTAVPLALLGHSRGSVPVMVTAAEDQDVAVVITWNGVAQTLRYGQEVIARWEEDGKLEFTNARTGQRMAVGWGFVVDAKENADRFDLERCARTMAASHLILHGTDDMAVPPEDARLLQAGREDPRRCQVVSIEGGTHTFGAVHPFEGTTPQLEEAIEHSRRWLRRDLPLDV